MPFIIVLTILTVIVLSTCKLRDLKDRDVEQRDRLWCNLSKIYTKHFRAAKTINVKAFLPNNNKFMVKTFTNELTGRIYNTKAAVLSMHKPRKFNSYQRKGYPAKIEIDDKHHGFVSDDQLFKVQRFSSDPQDIYMLIAWDPQSLHLHLDNNPKSVVAKARAMYSIFFVYRDDGSCTNGSVNDIANVLLRMWFDYKILNIVASAPYSCNPEHIYIYNPFKKIAENQWGLLKIYNLAEVVSYPYLIFNDLINLNQFPLKIAMFQRHPTSLRSIPKGLMENVVYRKIRKISGFGGLDGAVLATMATYLNFSVYNIHFSSNYFGFVFPNGSISGSLGQVVRKEVQLSANGRFITNYNTSEIEFTTSYTSDKICIVVPKAGRIPQWMLVFRCFKWRAWLCLFAIILLCIFIWSLQANTSRAWLDIISIFLSSPVKLPTNTNQGLFLASCMLLNLIIVGVFQGSLVRSFSTITYYSDIDTLEDLDRTGLPIYSSFAIFGSNESDLIKRLHSRTRTFFQNVVTLDEVAYGKKIAGVERKLDAELFLQSRYVGPDGNTLLHIMKECPISYFVAYIVPIGSPLVPRINWILRKFSESGLVHKWYHDTIDSLILEFQMKVASKGRIDQPFTLNDLQTAFIILVIGCLISTIIFVYEVCFRNNNKKKDL